jgi:hypothetical protein
MLRDLVERKLKALREPIEQALIGGSAVTLHDYHRLVGKLEGITNAFNEIEGLLGDEEPDDIGR